MPRKPRPRPALLPRKRPLQERARLTVAAIVEAIAQVLRDEGFDRMTTKRVADRAGVSVGSLYQYFPTREAMLVAVAERHLDEMRAVVARTLEGAPAMTLDELARALVRAAIETHATDPALHRRLMQEVPRVGRLAMLDETRRELHAVLVAFLRTRDDVVRDDLELVVFMAITAVDALAHAAVVDRAEALEDPAFEAKLADAVGRLLRA
jgi:AcrR family transcriptional regulator